MGSGHGTSGLGSSSRARAMARRRARLRRRRMMIGGGILAAALMVGGAVYGVAGAGNRKEKEAFLEAGVTSMEAGDYEAAIAEFEQGLSLAKGRIGELEEQTLLYRAEAEYRLQDYAAALHTYETLLQQDKDNEIYRKGAALAMIETGDYEGALKLHAADASVYSRMAKSQIEAGAYDEALASIEAGKAALGQENAESEPGEQAGAESAQGAAGAESAQGATAGADQEDDSSVRAELAFNEAVVWEYKSDYQKALELFEAYVQQYGSNEQADREITFLKTRQGSY
ncbi:MAG: hypothetical protein Q4F28_01895 [Eubacteriales bacterium]|nr:hypothetical protein [Eubacteriales bacterium]